MFSQLLFSLLVPQETLYCSTKCQEEVREEHRGECREILERKKAEEEQEDREGEEEQEDRDGEEDREGEEEQEDREGECLLDWVLGVSLKGTLLAEFWTKVDQGLEQELQQ